MSRLAGLLGALSLPEGPRWDSRDRDAAIVLLVGTASLVLFAYWGRVDAYFESGVASWVRDLTEDSSVDWVGSLAYVWWGVSSLLWRLAIPFALAWWLIGMRPSDLGLRFRGVGKHLPIYGALYLLMLPLLVLASSLGSFQDFYPFYDRAGQGGLAFWVFEAGYMLQFVGVEAFFRGFLTFGLAPRFGLLAIPMATLPYTMIHFGKPMPEAVGAIVAGLVLSYLALRTRSFVPGIGLHMGVAFTLDLLVLARLGDIGNIV